MRTRSLLALALLVGCPEVENVEPYPWRALGPAIAERLPWETLVQEIRPCQSESTEVLVLDDALLSPVLLDELNARVPRGYVSELWVFRASERRGASLAGWSYLVDGASFEVKCAIPLEVRGPLPEAFWDTWTKSRS